ncbi:MAG: hypothetical protein QXW97_02235 [Candidatus Pacearchaeota archaeon]
MVNRYIRFEYQKSKKIKESLDYAKNSLADILRILRNYKLSRKKELALKNKFKLSISTLRTKLNAVELTFPEEERKEIQEEYYKRQQTFNRRKEIENKRNKNIIINKNYKNDDYEKDNFENYEDELEEINDKLSKISS